MCPPYSPKPQPSESPNSPFSPITTDSYSQQQHTAAAATHSHTPPSVF